MLRLHAKMVALAMKTVIHIDVTAYNLGQVPHVQSGPPPYYLQYLHQYHLVSYLSTIPIFIC